MSISPIAKKVNIITCSFGEGRILSQPIPQITDHDVIFSQYTDENFPSRENALCPRLKGKIPKMLGYSYVSADYYIWIDSKFSIVSPNFVNWMVDNVDGYDIALFKHFNRSTIESEYIFVRDGILNGDEYLHSRYIGEDMGSQVEKYLGDEEYVDDKLFACGMFIYRKELIENHPNIMRDWLIENVQFSIQDQLSLPYLLQKNKVKYNLFSEHILHNSYITYV